MHLSLQHILCSTAAYQTKQQRIFLVYGNLIKAWVWYLPKKFNLSFYSRLRLRRSLKSFCYCGSFHTQSILQRFVPLSKHRSLRITRRNEASSLYIQFAKRREHKSGKAFVNQTFCLQINNSAVTTTLYRIQNIWRESIKNGSLWNMRREWREQSVIGNVGRVVGKLGGFIYIYYWRLASYCCWR